MTSATAVTQAHKDALSKAKIALMASPNSAFFTTVLFSLKQVWDASTPTLHVTGLAIHINPDFFLQRLTPELRVSALIHEAMHVAYLHCDASRKGNRDPEKWNWAGDYLINGQLKARGHAIGEGWLYDPQYAGLSTEQIYDQLPNSLTPPPMQDVRYGGGDPGAPDTQQVQREVEDILVRAAMQSKMAGDAPGTIPGDIEIFLDKLLNPKLPWHAILRKYMQKYAKEDYSFRRPNKRFFPAHYLPGLRSEALMDLTFAIDVSGSVSDAEFQQQVSDFASVLRMFKPGAMTLLQFDTGIRSVDTIKTVRDLMQVQFTGRGGTKIGPVLQHAHDKKPQVLIVMTDGYFRWPAMDAPGRTDVIWCIYNNPGFTAPFGKVIHYTMK